MNPNPDRKLTTLLFNPFVYIAGAEALLIGLGSHSGGRAVGRGEPHPF